MLRAKETGPYGYLTKPYSSKEFNATIAVAIQQHHLRRVLASGESIGRPRFLLTTRDSRLEPVRMAKIVNAVESDLAGAIADVDAKISCGPLPTVSGDPIQLKQLMPAASG